jgi:hypothetical protein
VLDLEAAHAARELLDECVVKALKISELAQIARIETRTREYLFTSFKAHANAGVKSAVAATEQGKSVAKIIQSIESAIAPWPNKALPVAKQSTKSVYKLARVFGWKRATGKIKSKAPIQYMAEIEKAESGPAAEVFPGLEVVDDKAIEALNAQNTFWIGSHYDRNLSDTIGETVQETVAKHGKDRATAGAILKDILLKKFGLIDIPAGFVGSSEAYFAGLVANTTTVARVFGQVTSFKEYGVTTYMLVNPGDSRTSLFCQHMNGKVFTVDYAVNQMKSELKVDNPEDIKKLHPWISVDQLKSMSPNAGHVSKADSAALAEAGLALPPYHWKCRTTVDMKS